MIASRLCLRAFATFFIAALVIAGTVSGTRAQAANSSQYDMQEIIDAGVEAGAEGVILGCTEIELLIGKQLSTLVRRNASVVIADRLRAAGLPVRVVAPYRWESADEGSRLAALVRDVLGGVAQPV